MPVICEPPRDQFSNGLEVKYETGMVIRRSSQVRTVRKVRVISSTVPHSPSTTTVSPIRTRSPKAICSPANILLRVDCAATPATMPRMPAEASSEAPAARIAGKTSSIEAAATTMTAAETTRMISSICVRTRRTRAGSRCAWALAYREYEVSTTAAAIRITSQAADPISTRASVRPMATRCSAGSPAWP